MDKLAANVDVDWRGQRASHADIAISRLTVDQHELTQFNAVLDGTTAEHAFKLDALAATTSVHLSGKGSFVDKVWNSTIADLMIDDTASLNLRLEAPVAITASAQSFKLGALCLRGKVAQLCGEGAWNPSAWNGRVDARNLPIGTLTAGLTPKVEYQGTVNASARLSGSAGAPFVGDARADLVDAAIRHKLASGRTDVISFGSGYLTLKAEPDHLNAELRLDAASRGLIVGRLRAERSGNEMFDWPMRAQLQMATGELGFITLYAQDIDRASGHFDANLNFDGTLGRPSASGIIELATPSWISTSSTSRCARSSRSAHQVQRPRVQCRRQGGRRNDVQLGKNRVARSRALRRHAPAGREPAHGGCARGAHRCLTRSSIQHRRGAKSS